jgi:hypothetical protein
MVQELLEGFSTLFVESSAGAFGPRGAGFEGIETAFVESVDGVAHRLGSATQRRGYLWRGLPASAGKQDLATTEDERVFRAETFLHCFLLGVAQRTYEDGRFHGYYYSPLHTTYLENALVTASALPLKAVETDFAVDSSGFSTSRYVTWFNKKHGKEMDNREWVKVHLMCGVRTRS